VTNYDPEAAGMERSWIGWLVSAVLAFGGAVLVWVFWLAGGSGEPTTELTTPDVTTTTVSVDTTVAADTESTEAADNTTLAFVMNARTFTTDSFRSIVTLHQEFVAVSG
jgi:hypothetical protein